MAGGPPSSCSLTFCIPSMSPLHCPPQPPHSPHSPQLRHLTCRMGKGVTARAELLGLQGTRLATPAPRKLLQASRCDTWAMRIAQQGRQALHGCCPPSPLLSASSPLTETGRETEWLGGGGRGRVVRGGAEEEMIWGGEGCVCAGNVQMVRSGHVSIVFVYSFLLFP